MQSVAEGKLNGGFAEWRGYWKLASAKRAADERAQALLIAQAEVAAEKSRRDAEKEKRAVDIENRLREDLREAQLALAEARGQIMSDALRQRDQEVFLEKLVSAEKSEFQAAKETMEERMASEIQAAQERLEEQLAAEKQLNHEALEREREAYLQHTMLMAMKRTMRLNLARSWRTWVATHRLNQHRRSLMWSAVFRLLKPKLSIWFSVWRRDWESQREAGGGRKGKAS